MGAKSFIQRLKLPVKSKVINEAFPASEGELLYQYHKLEEKDSDKVNSCWNGLQMTFLSLCTIFSLLALFFISVIIPYFDNLCVFNPKKIVFIPLTSFPNTTDCEDCIAPKRMIVNYTYDLRIDFIKSSFADHSKCFWPYFFPVFSIIYSIIWLTFFIMSKGLKQPWRMIIPSLIFINIFCIMCFVSKDKLINGALNFKNVFKEASIAANVEDHHQTSKILIYITIYIYSIWFNTIFWTLSAVLLIIRLISAADFNLVVVQVELVKLSPEDIPHLSKFDDSTQELPILTPKVKKKKNKNITSILKTSQDSTNDTKPSPKIRINPITVFVDVETNNSQNGKAPLPTMQVEDSDKEVPSERRLSTSSDSTNKSKE